MLAAQGCQARRQRLWQRLDPAPDWIILAEPQHLVYFANYWPSPFVFRSVNSAAVLLLSRDGPSVLVADSMLRMFLEAAHVDQIVAPDWYRGQTSAPVRLEHLVQAVLDQIQPATALRIAFEQGGLPAGIVDGLGRRKTALTLTPIDQVLRELKRSKDPDEVAVIRRSMQAGDAAHAAAMREIRPGMTELDAFLVVQNAAMQALGGQAMVYGDFVSGPRCEKGGGPPTGRIIVPRDLVLLDFSVVVHGYRGDFANTFACGGPATQQQRQLHEACLRALSAGEAVLRAGTAAVEVDRAVRASFRSDGVEKFFTSHSGHGLGLGHPDPPYFVPESTDTIVAGDVVAIEPGLFVPGVGGMRFERNYLVTETGFETLSKLELRIDVGG